MKRDEEVLFTQENVRKIFDYWQGLLYWRVNIGAAKPGKVAGTVSNGHRRVRVLGYTLAVRELVWVWHYGPLPPCGLYSVDGNAANTFIENIRPKNQKGVSFL